MHTRIMVNGRGGSGKDSIADYLVEKYGFKKLAFADGIYEIAHKYFGMKYKDRKLLQLIGQKMREIRPIIWVNYTFEQAKQYDKVVISDVRQANEYQIGLEYGFLPLRVEADLKNRIQRLENRDGFPPNISLLENESETGADGYNYIHIDNSGSFEELYHQIDRIMASDLSEYLKKIQMEFVMRQMY